MFTGIVQDLVAVTSINDKGNAIRFGLTLKDSSLVNLTLGASIAVDGVCLTVSLIDGHQVFFDVMAETLTCTTLKALKIGQLRNIERAATFGSEIGGHLVSGHVRGEATLSQIQLGENKQQINTFSCDAAWMRYILEKGFIALDGASLTIVNPQPSGRFEVHLIPETLARTTFGYKQVADKFNLEVDPQTQAIVDTVEKVLAQRG